jgi:hypothetical protein
LDLSFGLCSLGIRLKGQWFILGYRQIAAQRTIRKVNGLRTARLLGENFAHPIIEIDSRPT